MEDEKMIFIKKGDLFATFMKLTEEDKSLKKLLEASPLMALGFATIVAEVETELFKDDDNVNID